MKKLKRYQYERYAILCREAYPADFDHIQYGFEAEGRRDITDRWGRTIIRVLWGQKNEVIVVFKGSQNLWDWLLNFACFPKKMISGKRSYHVHWGYHFLLQQSSKVDSNPYEQSRPSMSASQEADFLQATDARHFQAESLYQQIRNTLAPLIQQGKRVSLTGHSSGGAMAVLTAERLGLEFPDAIKRIVTFGQPAAGFWSFKRAYSYQHCTYRICCDLDIVTFLPAIPLLYWHVGKMLWLHNEKIYDNISTPNRLYKSLVSWLLRPITYHYMHKYIRNKDYFDKH
ncbi:lipase [Photobacterium sp. 1_MG-2023]|uniref:lipase family protein n=1 Tax=Photobacterium sp. 1_MG-2023 TaxID=3062646 RepID=UPI0026E2D68E|nr:lipase [Photobacterium sp. 1_MG-2023]MDO6706653.1 lipase [Photobacterium sp. 1_MG-2023]